MRDGLWEFVAEMARRRIENEFAMRDWFEAQQRESVRKAKARRSRFRGRRRT